MLLGFGRVVKQIWSKKIVLKIISRLIKISSNLVLSIPDMMKYGEMIHTCVMSVYCPLVPDSSFNFKGTLSVMIYLLWLNGNIEFEIFSFLC